MLKKKHLKVIYASHINRIVLEGNVLMGLHIKMVDLAHHWEFHLFSWMSAHSSDDSYESHNLRPFKRCSCVILYSFSRTVRTISD